MGASAEDMLGGILNSGSCIDEWAKIAGDMGVMNDIISSSQLIDLDIWVYSQNKKACGSQFNPSTRTSYGFHRNKLPSSDFNLSLSTFYFFNLNIIF